MTVTINAWRLSPRILRRDDCHDQRLTTVARILRQDDCHDQRLTTVARIFLQDDCHDQRWTTVARIFCRMTVTINGWRLSPGSFGISGGWPSRSTLDDCRPDTSAGDSRDQRLSTVAGIPGQDDCRDWSVVDCCQDPSVGWLSRCSNRMTLPTDTCI